MSKKPAKPEPKPTPNERTPSIKEYFAKDTERAIAAVDDGHRLAAAAAKESIGLDLSKVPLEKAEVGKLLDAPIVFVPHADSPTVDADSLPQIDTPQKLAAFVDTGKLPLSSTCGNVVGSGATCSVDGTVAP